MTCFQGFLFPRLFCRPWYFYLFESVSVPVDISAFCRERCQTEQHGPNVVIRNGGLVTLYKSRTLHTCTVQPASSPLHLLKTHPVNSFHENYLPDICEISFISSFYLNVTSVCLHEGSVAQRKWVIPYGGSFHPSPQSSLFCFFILIYIFKALGWFLRLTARGDRIKLMSGKRCILKNPVTTALCRRDLACGTAFSA